jgi:hypothetical protein
MSYHYTLSDHNASLASIAIWIKSKIGDQLNAVERLAIARSLRDGETWSPITYVNEPKIGGPCDVTYVDEWAMENLRLKQALEAAHARRVMLLELRLRAIEGDTGAALEFCRTIQTHEIGGSYQSPIAGEGIG